MDSAARRAEPKRADPAAAFLADVLDGLAAPVRAVPARYFYDARGSELFDAITALPEYYLTRVETALLELHCPELALRVAPGGAVIELGAGSATKTPILLRAVQPKVYVPIDISEEHLRAAAASLQADFPGVAVHPVAADFMSGLPLPDAARDLPRLGFFPGSTIGNLVPGSAVDLLRALRAGLGAGSLLLIGMDRVKPIETLLAAYDDREGVTAAFNLNLLERINRELDADIPVASFRHRALWNPGRSRIEMHLEAAADVRFQVAGRPFTMRAGETIHTENSHKYGSRDARLLLLAAGWHAVAEWTDPDENFALYLAEAEPTRFAP
jgi:L-histidine N-alpha-methyltransferase